MQKGEYATLQMKKVLRAGDMIDKSTYSCEVLHYDVQGESIYFLLKSGKLTDLSLDAIYECKIQGEREELNCTGRIAERYSGEAGKTFKIIIENGFYKKI